MESSSSRNTCMLWLCRSLVADEVPALFMADLHVAKCSVILHHPFVQRFIYKTVLLDQMIYNASDFYVSLLLGKQAWLYFPIHTPTLTKPIYCAWVPFVSFQEAQALGTNCLGCVTSGSFLNLSALYINWEYSLLDLLKSSGAQTEAIKLNWTWNCTWWHSHCQYD